MKSCGLYPSILSTLGDIFRTLKSESIVQTISVTFSKLSRYCSSRHFSFRLAVSRSSIFFSSFLKRTSLYCLKNSISSPRGLGAAGSSRRSFFPDLLQNTHQDFRFLGLENESIRAETQGKFFVLRFRIGGRVKYEGDLSELFIRFAFPAQQYSRP